jgi:ketosteroid isomerase-like protein
MRSIPEIFRHASTAAGTIADTKQQVAIRLSINSQGKTNMQKLIAAFALLLLVAGPALASDKTDAMAAVQQFTDGFNKGDFKAAVANCADETSIVDNFPPHEWHGPGACTKWGTDLGAFMKSNTITDGVVTLGKPLHIDVTGDRAYIVVPTVFKFKMKGKPTNDRGQLTIALQKTGTAWRMTGWAWADQ